MLLNRKLRIPMTDTNILEAPTTPAPLKATVIPAAELEARKRDEQAALAARTRIPGPADQDARKALAVQCIREAIEFEKKFNKFPEAVDGNTYAPNGIAWKDLLPFVQEVTGMSLEEACIKRWHTRHRHRNNDGFAFHAKAVHETSRRSAATRDPKFDMTALDITGTVDACVNRDPEWHAKLADKIDIGPLAERGLTWDGINHALRYGRVTGTEATSLNRFFCEKGYEAQCAKRGGARHKQEKVGFTATREELVQEIRLYMQENAGLMPGTAEKNKPFDGRLSWAGVNAALVDGRIAGVEKGTTFVEFKKLIHEEIKDLAAVLKIRERFTKQSQAGDQHLAEVVNTCESAPTPG